MLAKAPALPGRGLFRCASLETQTRGEGYGRIDPEQESACRSIGVAATDARRAWRPVAQQLRRDVGGAVPDVGLRLFERRGGRGHLQGRERPLPVFALRQSHRHHVREPAGGARRRRGLPRHLDRHVGGVLRAAGAPEVGRSRRCGTPALRLVPLHRGRSPAQVRHPERVRRRRRSSGLGEGAVQAGAGRAVRIAVQPDARHRRHQGGVRPGPQGRRQGGPRQRLRHADPAATARMGRRHRRALRHQVHRRPGSHPGRRGAGLQGVHPREAAAHHPQHRPLAQPVQRLGAGQGPRDAGPAHRPPLRQRRARGRRAGRPSRHRAACSIPAAAIIRSTSSP